MKQKEILYYALIGIESELEHLKEIIRCLENSDDCVDKILLDDYKHTLREMRNKHLELNKMYEENGE